MDRQEVNETIELMKRDFALLLVMRDLYDWIGRAVSDRDRMMFERSVQNTLERIKHDNRDLADLPQLYVDWNGASPRLHWPSS